MVPKDPVIHMQREWIDQHDHSIISKIHSALDVLSGLGCNTVIYSEAQASIRKAVEQMNTAIE